MDQILYALPYALRGVSTRELPFNAVGQIVLPASLPPEVVSVLQSICEPCVLYWALNRTLKHSSAEGLLKQALYSAISQSLQSYLTFTSEIETKCMQQEFDLSSALNALESPCVYLRLFHLLLKQANSSRNVLSVVWEFTSHGDPLVSSYAQEVFDAVHEPFQRMKEEWEDLGSLNIDRFDEFYVASVDGEPQLRKENIPHGVMSEEAVDKSFEKGRAMFFIRSVCGDLEYVGNGKPFAEIVERSRKLLVEDNHLMLHLRGLRDYMLLTNGDFVDALFRNTSDILMQPAHSVHGVLDYAASSLFFDALSEITYEDPQIARAVDAKLLSASSGFTWETLVGDYHIDSRPVAMIVDSAALKQYTKCFALLWRVRLAVHSLDTTAAHLRLLSHSAEQFAPLLAVHTLLTQSFLTVQMKLYYGVIEKEWLTLSGFLQRPSLTTAQIKQAHESYLHRIAEVAGDSSRFRVVDTAAKQALELEAAAAAAVQTGELPRFEISVPDLAQVV